MQEEREWKKALFGNMKPLGEDEYWQVYKITGLDVDGRRALVEGHKIRYVTILPFKHNTGFPRGLILHADRAFTDTIYCRVLISINKAYVLSIEKSWKSHGILSRKFHGNPLSLWCSSSMKF